MSPLIIPLSIMAGLVLCATAVSVYMGYRAQRLLAVIDGHAQRERTAKDTQLQQLQPLRETVDALAAQLRDLQSHPYAPAPAGVPRSGFNLSKRSQALRLHRRGEAPEQIAASLELPRQEVDLLLKVHRIVIQNV
jgi:cell division protein FtsB